ncbi:hypothetical protein [Methylobacterium pseudosasicola]|uniref:Uncharacterized protein n=1 Tax=Methylobacterium pseudosasicola TaxID=582667 RepID=A0A1I4SCR5_9HYPH|nr:hypothetical protein [Methylobacterium pseudosasicola]SFM62267.1 hypothetical protein SAMN05192568_104153 [Methylobacterium pseudosasicola]
MVDPSGLPPVLAKLIAPWTEAIEASDPGMGNHIRAIAAHCFEALRRRVELTLPLERAFATARAETDALAAAMDTKHGVSSSMRRAARKSLADLVEALQQAEPNAVTKELGIGW